MSGALSAAAGILLGHFLGLEPGWWMAGPIGIGALIGVTS